MAYLVNVYSAVTNEQGEWGPGQSAPYESWRCDNWGSAEFTRFTRLQALQEWLSEVYTQGHRWLDFEVLVIDQDTGEIL